ncbi:MAG: RidA family protein [Puia sp.]
MPEILKPIPETVLQELEKELVKAGSSMKNVLKVSVFLNDIADYDGMNAVYRGRFGDKPPYEQPSQKEVFPEIHWWRWIV